MEKLNDFLQPHFPNEAIKVLALAGDASTRKYYRVIVGNQSYVLMEWEPFTDNNDYPFLSVLQHLEKHKVNVPEVLYKSPKQGLILLEDLGDLTLERKFWERQNQSHSVPFYKAALDQLLKVHVAATDDSQASCTAFKVIFDTDKLLWEMNYAKKHLLKILFQLKLSQTQENELENIFRDLCQKLDNEPKRISHRDFHSRNLMLKFDKIYMIDFQDARMGPVQYDLVSLLHDSYVNLSQETVTELIEYYQKQAQPEGLIGDNFDKIFKLQALQRCFKACGSFASFYNNGQDTRYLKYLKHTIESITRYLELYPEYSLFLDLLKDKKIRDWKEP